MIKSRKLSNKATRKNRTNKTNKTNKSTTNNNNNNTSRSIQEFEREITVLFLEMLLMIKLFHWKTHSYATHKATDELYSSLNEKMDQFIEILLGKTNTRIQLTNKKTIQLFDTTSVDGFKNKIDGFKSYLINLNENKSFNLMSNYDLLTVRDEILGDLNRFLYLLTFN